MTIAETVSYDDCKVFCTGDDNYDDVDDNYGKDEDSNDDQCPFDDRKYQEHIGKGHHKPSKSSGKPLVDSRQCTLILQRSSKYQQCNKLCI